MPLVCVNLASFKFSLVFIIFLYIFLNNQLCVYKIKLCKILMKKTCTKPMYGMLELEKWGAKRMRRNEWSQKPTTTKMCLSSFEKDLIIVVFWEWGSLFYFTFINNVISFTYLVSKPNHPFLHQLNQNCGYINNIRE